MGQHLGLYTRMELNISCQKYHCKE